MSCVPETRCAETNDPRVRVVALYERFAASSSGWSPLYARIAAAIAQDPWTLEFLAGMPEPKWQPNLLLAAVRYLYGTPEEPGAFLDLV